MILLGADEKGSEMTVTIPHAADRSAVSGRVRLRPRTSAARIVRRLVRDLCAGSRLPDELIGDAMLVASHLVTISVKQSGMALDVVVEVDADTVTVRVQDGLGEVRTSAVRRGWKGASQSQEIIARRSTSWGYYRCGSGRETWASFRAEPRYITI
jgi:hypothetical protein